MRFIPECKNRWQVRGATKLEDVKIKARTYEQAAAFINAGANLIGTSRGVEMVSSIKP